MKRSNFFFLWILALLLSAGYLISNASASNENAAEPSNAGALPRQAGDDGYLTGPNDGEPLEIALEYLDKNKGSLGLTSDDLADVVVTDQYTSKHNGVTHIYLRQRHKRIEVFNANLNINIAADGSVINLGHSFISDLAKAINTTTASLSARQAVESAAEALKLKMTEPLSLLEEIGGPANEVRFSDGGISLNDIPVKLMYQPFRKEVRLAWNLSIYELDAQHWWEMRVDALTGKTLDQNNLVIQESWGHSEGHDHSTDATVSSELATCTATGGSDEYCVYAMPVESPSHGSRTMESNSADLTASPYGWHDTNGAAGAESNHTVGNNVNAYEDTDNSNVPTGGDSARADGGANRVFNFDVDLGQAPSTYQDAAVANLFYWNNIIHDVWYQYGFDEASGNFQENNYGNGGVGSDSVNAEAQDGGGTNNANFATPPDGSNPRMQMYLWNLTSPHRDGDFDNGIIIHEYGHGISIRLTGGPGTSSCLNNSEQGGEGWSDWFGLMMTMEAGDIGTDGRGIGTYALGQPTTGVGIRPAPYSTDMGINNYTYGDIGGQAIPHGVGFVWATMMWEMNWALIDQYGFDPDFYGGSGGNNIAMQLVIDGLKLQPCSPGFVDARDAILAADVANNGGANQCLIWEAFAKRGLGYSATQGSSGSTSDGSEAFDMPPACDGLVATPASQDICVGDTATYGVSVGQAFSPPITMSASGQPAGTNASFSPHPVVTAPSTTTLTIGNTGGAATGNHTITIMGTDGTNTSQTTADLNVFNSNPGSLTLNQPSDGATGVSPSPTFEWTAATQAATYLLEVDDDSAFGSIDYTATASGTSHNPTSSLSPLTTYYWRVRAMNPCGNGSYSAVFSFTTQDIPPILVVDDDDNGPDMQSTYTDVLDALGQQYDVWDTNNSDNEPSAVDLAPYDMVIWFTGDEFGGSAGPGATGEAALGTYLDGGKCLFISSQDYYYDRGLTQFMQDYLGVDSATSDIGQTTVTGDGIVFGGLGSYALSYPFTNYSDVVTPDATAELAFSGNGGDAAVDKDSGVYRTTFWGFPFEALPTATDQQTAMQTVIDWCGTGAPTLPDIEVDPTSISVTVPEGDSTTETLNIGNVGDGTLNWNISTTADNEVVGEWTVYYDWGCDGSPGSAIVTFYEDFTFTTSGGYSGTWVLSGNEIVFTFTSGTEYTGTIDGDSMVGTMISSTGSTGCWTADRVTGMSGYVTLHSGEYTVSGEIAEEPRATTEYFVNSSDWLSANPTSGTEAAGASTDVTVSIDATNLTAGTYNDTLTITSNDPDEATVEVPVTLTVSNSQPAVISDIRESNVRDVSFTVSWLTDIESTGEVHYGTDPNNLDQTASDDRGAGTSDDTHYVIVSGLEADTTYYFDVVSGSTTDDNGGAHYSLTTGSSVDLPSSDMIYGQVFTEDGTTVAEGTIVYITLSDRDGAGSSGQAALLSSLVNSAGYWGTNLGNARMADLSDYFDYSASGDRVGLEAIGAADGVGCERVDTANDTPAASITLNVSDCTITWPMSLQTGWNHISLPVEPITNPLTAADVCDEINAQGGSATEIDRWHNGGWDGHICGVPFNDFDLVLGSDYFIKSSSPSTWELVGYEVIDPVPLDILFGWTSIGIPHTDAYSAESLCDEMIDQGVTALEIDRWHNGGWDGHLCGYSFNDFDIERGTGYFVKSSSAGTVIPDAPATSLQLPAQSLPRSPDSMPVGDSMPVRDLRIGNKTDSGVTLSWLTEQPTTGYVLYGETPELGQVAVDVRGAAVSARAHLVTLTNLKAETSYYFKVVSGVEDESAPSRLTTAPSLENIPASDTVYGQVFKADGETPATGTLVYLRLQDNDGVGSTGEATLLSALVDSEGYWHANLGNARLSDFSDSFSYSASDDELLIEAQGGSSLTVSTSNDAQAPDMILTTDPTSITVGEMNSMSPQASSLGMALALLALTLLAGVVITRRRL